jgi:hypothetical protein
MSDAPETELRNRIDAIEEAYEFMLAYAAQGIDRDDESETGGVRKFLSNAAQALDGLHQVVMDQAKSTPTIADQWTDYLKILKTDAAKAHTMIIFTLSQPILSSELIDNLNATNHIRTLLTDIFLLDSAFDAHDNA